MKRYSLILLIVPLLLWGCGLEIPFYGAKKLEDHYKAELKKVEESPPPAPLETIVFPPVKGKNSYYNCSIALAAPGKSPLLAELQVRKPEIHQKLDQVMKTHGPLSDDIAENFNLIEKILKEVNPLLKSGKINEVYFKSIK